MDPLITKSSVQPQAGGGNLLDTCSPSANLEAWLSSELAGVKPCDVCATWGQLLLAVHGTSFERAISILRDGKLYSHFELRRKHPEIAADRMANATDVLDCELGLDRCVFLSVGRVHPLDMQEVYFCFPNSIMDQECALVALREIVHFGALVSPEAVNVHREATGASEADVIRQNARAAIEFSGNVFAGHAFAAEVLPRFLQKHYAEDLAGFFGDLTFPGTKPRVVRSGALATLKNVWEGPQLMIPDEINVRRGMPAVVLALPSTPKRDA